MSKVRQSIDPGEFSCGLAIDEEPSLIGMVDVSEEDGMVEVSEEISGHYCLKCRKLRSLSFTQDNE